MEIDLNQIESLSLLDIHRLQPLRVAKVLFCNGGRIVVNLSYVDSIHEQALGRIPNWDVRVAFNPGRDHGNFHCLEKAEPSPDGITWQWGQNRIYTQEKNLTHLIDHFSSWHGESVQFDNMKDSPNYLWVKDVIETPMSELYKRLQNKHSSE